MTSMEPSLVKFVITLIVSRKIDGWSIFVNCWGSGQFFGLRFGVFLSEQSLGYLT